MGKAANQRVSRMIHGLRLECPDMKIIHFQEVKELQNWKTEEDLFDATELHPNRAGHAKLQEAVHMCWIVEGFPTASAVSLPDSTQCGGAPLTLQKTEMPSKLALDAEAC